MHGDGRGDWHGHGYGVGHWSGPWDEHVVIMGVWPWRDGHGDKPRIGNGGWHWVKIGMGLGWAGAKYGGCSWDGFGDGQGS